MPSLSSCRLCNQVSATNSLAPESWVVNGALSLASNKCSEAIYLAHKVSPLCQFLTSSASMIPITDIQMLLGGCLTSRMTQGCVTVPNPRSN